MSTSADSQATLEHARGEGYLLERSHAAACRLNYQHYLWKDNLGFMIHPLVPVPPNAVIADVAAGSGLWLIDVARQLPEAKLEGLDVDLKQAPHPTWLPKNINFRHWDIFTDLPDDLVGKYDLVHARLLVMAIENGEATRPVIRNMLRMLKPGGYLQWDELSTVDMSTKKPDPSLPAPGLEALETACRAGGRYDWTVKLPDYMREEGFQDPRSQLYGDRDDLVRAFNDQHLMTMQEVAASLARIGKEDVAAEFNKHISDAYQESIQGAAMCLPRIVVVARKAG